MLVGRLAGSCKNLPASSIRDTVLTAATLGLVDCSSDSDPEGESVQQAIPTVDQTTGDDDTQSAEEASEADALLTLFLTLHVQMVEANEEMLALDGDDAYALAGVMQAM